MRTMAVLEHFTGKKTKPICNNRRQKSKNRRKNEKSWFINKKRNENDETPSYYIVQATKIQEDCV